MAYNNSINNTIYGTFTVGNMTFTATDEVITISGVTTISPYIAGGKGLFTNNSTLDAAHQNKCYILNDSSDAGSHSKLRVTMAAAVTGNPLLVACYGGNPNSHAMCVGIHNSVTTPSADCLSIAGNTNLTTYNTTRMYTGGEVTIESCPAFMIFLANTQFNQTGNGTARNPLAGATEVFDTGNAVSLGVFTASATAKYHFTGSCYVGNFTNATYGQLLLVTSNKTYVLMACDVGSVTIPGNGMQLFGSMVCDMDALDTAFLQVMTFGESANNNYIAGNSSLVTHFAGFLAN